MIKRLQNVLAHAGVASRRSAGAIIEEGRVKVDGNVVTEKGFKLDPARHSITVNGKPLPREEKKRYIIFNKPADVISTAKDTHSRKKVTDFFKEFNERLYPVGRLDKDTTGLLIMTNDGALAHRLSHPSFEVEKEYRVTVRGNVPFEDVKALESGAIMDGKKTAPCKIKPISRDDKISVYLVTIHEGKKRHIRRMFQEIGGRVVALKRQKYGPLALRGLPEGSFRELSESEVKKLRSL